MNWKHALICSLALIAACSGRHRAHGVTDAGTTPPGDGGSTPPPPPGALTLAVESAAWFTSSSLLLQVRVGNGAGSDPAPLTPAFFALFSGGAEITSSGGSGVQPCRAELAVAAGSSVACQLVFDLVSGAPVEVRYRPPTRSATAPIAACAPASPSGLCAFDTVCLAGTCQSRCGHDHPDGICADTAMVCVSGSCMAPCSSANPTGACTSGLCVDGRCDTSCHYYDPGGTGCVDCMSALLESTVCGNLGESPCGDAIQCPLFSSRSTCECLDDASVVPPSCRALATTAWSCASAQCPSCVSSTPPL